MLDIDSPRWSTLQSSVGGDGCMAASLIAQIRDGDDTAHDDLIHQACHQFTVGEVAYAVIPHMVDVATNVPLDRRLHPLALIGSVEAGRMTYSQSSAAMPSDLRDVYFAATKSALPLAPDAMRHHAWEPSDSHQLIATIAALHGLTDLAMQLFLSGPELSCPECGEYIRFGEAD